MYARYLKMDIKNLVMVSLICCTRLVPVELHSWRLLACIFGHFLTLLFPESRYLKNFISLFVAL